MVHGQVLIMRILGLELNSFEEYIGIMKHQMYISSCFFLLEVYDYWVLF